MNARQTRTYNNFTALYAVQEVDELMAIEIVSNPDLNGEDLSELLTCSIMGTIINKETKKPLKLSTKVMQAAMLNKFEQLSRTQ